MTHSKIGEASIHAVAARAPFPVERLVATVLSWGGAASILLVLLGLGLHVARGGLDGGAPNRLASVPVGHGALPPGVYTSVGAVIRALRHHPLDPLGVIAAGLLLLIVTPAVGVAATVPAFVRAGDRRYALIASAVLALLVLGFVLAGAA